MSNSFAPVAALIVLTLFMIVSLATLSNHNVSAPQGQLAVAAQTAQIDG